MTTLCIILPLEVKLVCSQTISPTQVTISPSFTVSRFTPVPWWDQVRG